MALTLFEDFEDGAVDALYPGKTGTGGVDSWSVSPNNRSTGFGAPRYRPSPDTTNNIQAAPGVPGSQALAFVGNSAYSLQVAHHISDGLGGYFYSNSAGPGGGVTSSGAIQVQWLDNYANQGGSVTVNRIGAVLQVGLIWFREAEYETGSQSVTVTDFLPVSGLTASGLWLEVRFHRTEGWSVRDAATGSTLAGGAYPWSIPAVGLDWDLSYFPNSSGPAGAAGSSRTVVDQLYGYPGRDRVASAVRKYPRDDEYGYSGGRRLYPPPRLARIIGAQS